MFNLPKALLSSVQAKVLLNEAGLKMKKGNVWWVLAVFHGSFLIGKSPWKPISW